MCRCVAAFVVAAFVVGCADAPEPPTVTVPIYGNALNVSDNANDGNFGTSVSADEEVPPNSSSAVGSAVFSLSADGTELSYRLIVANIENVFQAHIHRAAAGVNGPIVVWLYPSTAPAPGPLGGGRIQGVIAEGTIIAANLVGPLAGSTTLQPLLDMFQSGTAYVNAHTNDGVAPTNTGPGDIPGGEVRGQVEVRGQRQ